MVIVRGPVSVDAVPARPIPGEGIAGLGVQMPALATDIDPLPLRAEGQRVLTDPAVGISPRCVLHNQY